MALNSLGEVKEIAVSGDWGIGDATSSRDLFYRTLRNTKQQAQISTYSLGSDNEEVNEFFDIVELLLINQRNITLIVNDDGKKNGSCSEHAKKKIARLIKKFPGKFIGRYFYSTKNKILHAKIMVVDKKTALIGSANISRGALLSNYEVMIKIGNPASTKLSHMLESLSKQLELENK